MGNNYCWAACSGAPGYPECSNWEHWAIHFYYKSGFIAASAELGENASQLNLAHASYDNVLNCGCYFKRNVKLFSIYHIA